MTTPVQVRGRGRQRPLGDAEAWSEGAPSGTRWTPLERTSGLLFVVLVSTLTLEWISLGGFLTGNIKYFHFAAVAFMTVSLLRYRPGYRLAPILGRYQTFYGFWVLYLLLVTVIGLAHFEPYFSRSEVVRQVFYGTVSVFVAAFFLDVDGRNVRRVLQWTGVMTVGTVMAGMGLALLGQSVNPLQLVGEAIAKGDPNMLSYQLLRLSFRSQELTEVGANLRHKVFSAVLIGLLVALICRTRPRGTVSRWRDRLFLVSAAVGALLVVSSLSRSVILCLLIALGLYGLRIVIQGRASPRQLAVILATLAATVILAVSPLGSFVWYRFAVETGSYESRVAALESAFLSVDAAVLGIGAGEVTTMPHNLILDAWLSAGVLGAVCTAVFLFIYLRVWLRETYRYLTGAPGWMLSLQQFWVVAVGVIPLVRAVTAARGFHLNDWVCIGIVFGLVEANRRAAAPRLGRHATLRYSSARQPRLHLSGDDPSR